MLHLGTSLAGRNATPLYHLSSLPCTTLQGSRRKNCRIDDDAGSRRAHRVVVAATTSAAGAGDGHMVQPSLPIEDRPLVGRLMTNTQTRPTPSYGAFAAAGVSAPALIEEKMAITPNVMDVDKLSGPAVVSPRNVASVGDSSAGGSGNLDPEDFTVLQKHVAYFDRNRDGVVYPTETFEGFRALGFPTTVSVLAAILINTTMSYATYDGWIPDPRFPIYIETIHRAKHGSDADVYDREGKFIEHKFDEIFQKFAVTHPDKMSLDELMNLTNSLHDANDFYGRNTNFLEWQLTHSLAQDSEGFASKDAIRGVYDGSFFNYIEDKLKKEGSNT